MDGNWKILDLRKLNLKIDTEKAQGIPTFTMNSKVSEIGNTVTFEVRST